MIQSRRVSFLGAPRLCQSFRDAITHVWCIGLTLTMCVPGLVSTASANVSFAPKSGNTVDRISVSGTITKDDLIAFQAYASVGRKGIVYQVLLDSNGGDVETAISMGKILRADGAKAFVAVMEGKRCVSACVFILAGGVNRDVWGKVGIHRPYSPTDTQISAALQKQNYGRIERQVKGYLEEVNIPTELFDHMMRIPPEKMKYLSKDELQRYGLNENDPFQDAARIAEIAKSWGVTTQEVIKRQARVNAECKRSVSNEDTGLCAKRIYGGR